MNRLVPILLLGAFAAAPAPAVEWGLPWFHTRPKPVFLDDQSSGGVSQKMVKRAEYRPNAADKMYQPVWTDSEKRRDPIEKPAVSRSKSTSKTSLR